MFHYDIEIYVKGCNICLVSKTVKRKLYKNIYQPFLNIYTLNKACIFGKKQQSNIIQTLYTIRLSTLKDFIETVYTSKICQGHNSKLLLSMAKLWYRV